MLKWLGLPVKFKHNYLKPGIKLFDQKIVFYYLVIIGCVEVRLFELPFSPGWWARPLVTCSGERHWKIRKENCKQTLYFCFLKLGHNKPGPGLNIPRLGKNGNCKW